MTSPDAPEEHLDFSAPATVNAGQPACVGCGKAIDDQYWSVGTAVICSVCRENFVQENAGTAGRGRRFSMALLLGIGGMIAGAAIWYGVAKLMNLEIGLIAILLGWLVGKGVMKGSGERGGRRYQVMAVVLTYLGIGLGYLPFVFEAQSEKNAAAATMSSDSTTALQATAPPAAAAGQPNGEASDSDEEKVGLLEGLGALLILVATLPMLIVQGGFPGSLISVLIYGFAILQAWKLTAARDLAIAGPFRVGSAATA